MSKRSWNPNDGGECHNAGVQYTREEKYQLLSRAVATKKDVYFTQLVIGGKRCMSRSSGINQRPINMIRIHR